MVEPPAHQHIVFVIAMMAIAIAAVSDLRRGEIPNWLTFGALALGPVLHIGRMLAAHAASTETTALAEGGHSMLGALACVVIPILMYRQGAIGGGDVKLLAALGALLQTAMGIEAELYGLVAAALVAPVVLALQGKLGATIANSVTIFANLFRPESKRQLVERSSLTWFRLGPALLFGVAITSYLHW